MNHTVVSSRIPRLALPGFYPDPSICRRGDDLYLVNSSFGFFPGLPIHHSRDLVNWTLIGHALDRPSQLPLAGAPATVGVIYAPTIRYHDNRFWIATTNVTHGGHLIIHAENPDGPWSDPVWIDAEHQGGIDPDLFWDKDGACWFSCTRRDREPAEPPTASGNSPSTRSRGADSAPADSRGAAPAENLPRDPTSSNAVGTTTSSLQKAARNTATWSRSRAAPRSTAPRSTAPGNPARKTRSLRTAASALPFNPSAIPT